MSAKGRMPKRGVTLPCPACGTQLTITPPHVHLDDVACGPRCHPTYNSQLDRKCRSETCRADVYAAIGEALSLPIIAIVIDASKDTP